MGVRRFARPAGIYVPNPPSRGLTSDMISPPLSPNFDFDSESLMPSIIPALEYISSKLQQKMLHVTLIVGRGKPFPTGQASDLMIIPVTSLDAPSARVLDKAVAKAAKCFALGQSWTDALARGHHERQANEYLVQQSILQNEVLFSREGLTLLNMDRIFTFKRRLCVLANTICVGKENDDIKVLEDTYIASCVQLLYRTIRDFQGRPFSKAFFHRVYEQLDVRDELLTRVADAYRSAYQQDGIIVLTPVPRPQQQQQQQQRLRQQRQKQESTRRSPIRVTRGARRQAGSPRYGMPARRGPKTPQSASDVTPITTSEWKMLVGPEFRPTQPTVTKWTPSPVLFAVA